MSTSLYDLTVGSYTQVLTSSLGVLEKGKTFCEENGISFKEMLEARLQEDMQGLYFQLISLNHHSANVIRALGTGEFGPPSEAFGHEITDADFDALIDLTKASIELMKAQDADTINGFAGGSIIFKLGKNELPFTTENFVLSFSLPNFYFHATTAYDIFRMKGVPLGKTDFLGKLKMGK
jgi:hypothetical protein